MKRRAFIPHKRDVNRERAATAGYAARLVDRPSTQCPNLARLFDETRATVLMNAWMEGWHEADRKLKQPKLEPQL